jgi:hypothetical protein
VKPLLATLFLIACFLACNRRESPPTKTATTPTIPRYYIVGRNPTKTLDNHSQQLLPGFGVVIVDQYRFGGEWIGRSSLGREIPMRDLHPATPSKFSGVEVDGNGLNFGWVVKGDAPVYAEPDITSKAIARRAHYVRLTLSSLDGPQGFFRVAGGWMSEADLRVPHRATRPPAVGNDEPWIDVELATQTLVAYQGDNPVFATLVATGVGSDGTPFATPRGIHTIRAKLLAATMDNLEHTGVVPYSYEEVPFTQYIGRVALHGAFWHDQFGIPRTHGCINLSLADAERMFAFTKPELPKGEKEVSAKTGTVVRVR